MSVSEAEVCYDWYFDLVATPPWHIEWIKISSEMFFKYVNQLKHCVAQTGSLRQQQKEGLHRWIPDTASYRHLLGKSIEQREYEFEQWDVELKPQEAICWTLKQFLKSTFRQYRMPDSSKISRASRRLLSLLKSQDLQKWALTTLRPLTNEQQENLQKFVRAVQFYWILSGGLLDSQQKYAFRQVP